MSSEFEAEPPIHGRLRTFALISLFLALFMELLDATIVNVALPSIEKSLGANGGETTSWHLAAGLLLGGAGMGMVVAPIGIFVLSEVPVSQAGPASGLYNTVQQLAGAIGIATLGTVFFSRLDSLIERNPQKSQDAFVQSYELTLWVMVAILILSSLVAGFLPKQPSYDDTLMAH